MKPFKWVNRNLVYPGYKWMQGNLSEIQYRQEFERTQFADRDVIESIQWERLTSLLRHANEFCPFYREQWERAGLAPTSLKSPHDFAAWPVLKKADIQHHQDRMVSTAHDKSILIPNQTGGSTGEPISFFLTPDRLAARHAATHRHNAWAGLDIGTRLALVWGAVPDQPLKTWKSSIRDRLFGQRIFLDTSNLNQTKFESFNERLCRFRPQVIQAYARSMALFADYLDRNNIPAYQPKSIITSAEMLTTQDRELIERVFQAPIFNRYGCREVSIIASECAQHNGLHLMEEGLYVEILVDGKPARPGTVGKVVVTDLLNLGMPMIRYEIGDLAAIDESPCACGRQLRRLKSINGRSTDFLRATDGSLVSGVFLATYVIAQRPQLGQIQFLQERIDEVVVRVARKDRTSIATDDAQFLESGLRKYLGDSLTVRVEICNEIEQAPSGKLRYCISKLESQTS